MGGHAPPPPSPRSMRYALKAALENKRTSIIENLVEKYKGKLEHSKKLSKQYFASVRKDSFAEDNLINHNVFLLRTTARFMTLMRRLYTFGKNFSVLTELLFIHLH